MLESPLLDSLLDGNPLENQTISVELFHRPQPDEYCSIFDPVNGSLSLAMCDSFRGVVCQFKKGASSNNVSYVFVHNILNVLNVCSPNHE